MDFWDFCCGVVFVTAQAVLESKIEMVLMSIDLAAALFYFSLLVYIWRLWAHTAVLHNAMPIALSLWLLDGSTNE